MPISIPWAPRERYESNSDIPRLILEGGRQQAEGQLRSGSVWANLAQQLGQIPQQVIAMRDQSEERKARTQEREDQAALRRAQKQKMDREARIQGDVGGAMSGYGQKGFDINAAVQQLPPESRAAALKLHGELEESRAKAQKAREEADRYDALKLAKAAHAAESLLGTPMAETGLGLISEYLGQDHPEEMARVKEMVQKDPASLKPFLKHLQEQSPEWMDHLAKIRPKLGEAPPGTTVYDQSTGETKFVTPAKPENRTPEEDFTFTKYGANPTAEQRLSAKAQFAAAGRDPNDNAAPSMSSGAIDSAARRYNIDGTLPPMGMGKAGAQVRQVILNRANELDPTANIAGNKASYTADKASLQTLQKQTDAVTAFEKTAEKNTKILEDAMKALPDSGVKFLNRPLRGLASEFGSETMSKFKTIRQSVQNEYARIISNPTLAGQMSDSARKEGEALLSPDLTVGQLRAAIKTLHAEAGNRRTSYQEQLAEINRRIGGKKDEKTQKENDPGGLFGK